WPGNPQVTVPAFDADVAVGFVGGEINRRIGLERCKQKRGEAGENNRLQPVHDRLPEASISVAGSASANRRGWGRESLAVELFRGKGPYSAKDSPTPFSVAVCILRRARRLAKLEQLSISVF